MKRKMPLITHSKLNKKSLVTLSLVLIGTSVLSSAVYADDSLLLPLPEPEVATVKPSVPQLPPTFELAHTLEGGCGTGFFTYSADGKSLIIPQTYVRIKKNFVPFFGIMMDKVQKGKLRFWDIKSGEITVEAGDFSAKDIHPIIYDRGNKDNVIVGSFQENKWGSIQVWNVSQDDNEKLYKDGGIKGMVFSLTQSTDGSLLAAACDDGKVRLWNSKTAKPIGSWAGAALSAKGVARALAFSPDDALLAAGADDGSIRVWDVKSQQLRAQLEGHKARVTWVGFIPQNAGKQTLVSASEDGTVRFWDVASKTVTRVLEVGDPENQRHLWFSNIKHKFVPVRAALSPDGRLIAVANGRLQVWDIQTGMPLSTLADYTESGGPRAFDVQFSPDGKQLACSLLSPWVGDEDLKSNNDVIIRLWDIKP